MKYIGLILIPPIATITFLLLMVADLVGKVLSKPPIDEDW